MKGYTLYEDEEGNRWWWKDCIIPGCVNQVCTWKSDRFCYPHSDSGQTIDELIAEHSEEPVHVRAV